MLAAILALASGCVRGLGSPEEPLVESFELRGVKAFDVSELEEVLATRGPARREGISGLVVKDRHPLDPDALATDRRRVEAFYRERGWYGARVEEVRVVPSGKGLVKVTMVVREGAPARVTKLVLRGMEEAPEAAAELRKPPLRTGGIFAEAAYDAMKAEILRALRATGWATAEVEASALVLPETEAAEVTFAVRPGRRWRFGPIFVAGSASVPRERIRAQAAVAIRAGDFWDESRLARAQARVFDLGVFGGVRVVRGDPDPERGTIPVVVAVREAPFRTLRLGPGFAFEKTRWEARGAIGWRHRNFLGGLRNVGVDARGGYTWLDPFASTRQEAPVASLAADFQQPAAFGSRLDASARVEVERGLEPAYAYWVERLRLGLPVRIASRWSFVPSYNLEVFHLSGFATDFVPGTGGTGLTLENCEGSVCLLTYFEQRVAWDGRDHPVNTRRGLYVALALQEGFAIGSYGYRYLRFLPEVRAFRPLGEGAVLAARARVGGLVPVAEEGAPPIVARFTAGGPSSMRGYYTGRLAPMELQQGIWVPVGGNGILDGSLELRFDLAGDLGAAIFVDAASVARATSEPSRWRDVLDPRSLQVATGAGLRYRTPFGPLRLDVGVRLLALDGTWFPPVPHTAWPDGTPHGEPIVSVHISLGEAF